MEYDNTICFASVNATCLNLIGGTYSTAQKELYLSFAQFFSVNQEKKMEEKEKKNTQLKYKVRDCQLLTGNISEQLQKSINIYHFLPHLKGVPT